MSEQGPCGFIMAVMLDQRVDNAPKVQEVLTKHGCAIRLRVGLHETDQQYCANWGLIILQVCGSCDDARALESDLGAVGGVKVKMMKLDFD